MSEPIIERLSQFTPAAGNLDRDALLFAAGRASARPNRRWQALSALLAGMQVLTLAFLLPRLATPSVNHSVATAPASAPSNVVMEQAFPKASAIWSVHHGLDDIPMLERISDSLVLVDSEPHLRAFGGALSSTVN